MISILSQYRRTVLVIGATLIILVLIVGFAERRHVRRMLHGGRRAEFVRAADGPLDTPPMPAAGPIAGGAIDANEDDGLPVDASGMPIINGSESFAQFSARRRAEMKGQPIDDSGCVTDCTRYQQGYGWAKAHAINDGAQCRAQTGDFNEGCLAYLHDQSYRKEDAEREKSYLDMVQRQMFGNASGAQ